MTDKPSVVIVSDSKTKPSSIIKLITRLNNINPSDSLTIQPWSIDTKYYTAEVDLIGVQPNYVRTEQFNKCVEALLIHMDSNKDSGLDDLKQYQDIEKECNPEVKLLLSNYCNSKTKITIDKALEWCLKNGYELVELFPTVKKDTEEDDAFKEKVGVERVIEALHAHTWPNLKMKSKKKGKPKKEDDLNDLTESQTETADGNPELEGQFDEEDLNDGLDDFASLISQLNTVRTSIQNLTPSQRKHCAEQMATAFWKAIGGEEEEIADL